VSPIVAEDFLVGLEKGIRDPKVVLEAVGSSGLACAFWKRFLCHELLLVGQELIQFILLIASERCVVIVSSLVLVLSHGLLLVRFLGQLPDRLVMLAYNSTTWLVEIKLGLEFGRDRDGIRVAGVYWNCRAGVALVFLCVIIIGLIASTNPPWTRVLQNLQMWLLNLTFPLVQVHSDLLYQQHMLCSLLLKIYCRFSHLIENILLLLIHRGHA